MPRDLLVMAWPYKGQVLSSLRWADDYFMPSPFKDSNATVVPISSSVNATGFELIYRCQNCLSWTHQGNQTGSVATTDGAAMFGFAQGSGGPQNPGCPDQITFDFHDNGYGQWLAGFGNATNLSYTKWAGLAKPATGPVAGPAC